MSTQAGATEQGAGAGGGDNYTGWGVRLGACRVANFLRRLGGRGEGKGARQGFALGDMDTVARSERCVVYGDKWRSGPRRLGAREERGRRRERTCDRDYVDVYAGCWDAGFL